MSRLKTFRVLARPMLLGIALIATGCSGGGEAPMPPRDEVQEPDNELRDRDSVVFHPLRSTVSPFETVTIEVDHERGTVEVVPHMAVIWVDSENYPVSQLLWTVRCVGWTEEGKGEVACPRDVSVAVHAKDGCPRDLFGTSPGAEPGEIVIEPGHNAVPSGPADLEVLERLFKPSLERGEPCAEPVPCNPLEQRAAMDETPMFLRDSVHDYAWVYEVVVRREGKEIFRCDPEVWIERDNSGGSG